VTKKSYLVSLAVQAMCLGRVNIMNRRNQGRQLNFNSYQADLETTLADLAKMRDADAVSKWLEYRVNLHSTGLHKYFQLDARDFAVCKARTVLFVGALLDSLRLKMAALKQIAAFDVFGPAETEEGYKANADYGKPQLEEMYNTWMKVYLCWGNILFFSHFIFLFSFISTPHSVPQKRNPNLTLLQLFQEWGTFQVNGLPLYRRLHPEGKVIDMMFEVLSNHSYDAYVNLKELFAIALTMILSTSISESGFSLVNAIKTEHSNALADDTLDAILNFRFSGPPEMPVCAF
jgi:hypothetical protein